MNLNRNFPYERKNIMADKENILICKYCGREIEEEEAIYVEGEPYCSDCYSEAEFYSDIPDD